MLIDTHAHYTDVRYDDDREVLLSNIVKSGINKIINVGYNIKSSVESIELAKKYEYIYAVVGVHPQDIEKENIEDVEKLLLNVNDDKIVAVGEIGLEYYYEGYDKDLQKDWFVKQIHLANKYNLPIVIHIREAYGDAVDILKHCRAEKNGVVHCFGGSIDVAREVLNLGYYVSFGGPITFKNAKGLLDVVKYIPIDRILLETDCPYLSPEPFRGLRNDSTKISFIADRIAELKGLSREEIENITTNNALKVFTLN